MLIFASRDFRKCLIYSHWIDSWCPQCLPQPLLWISGFLGLAQSSWILWSCSISFFTVFECIWPRPPSLRCFFSCLVKFINDVFTFFFYLFHWNFHFQYFWSLKNVSFLVSFFFHALGLFNLTANFLIPFAAFPCMLLIFLSRSWTEFICFLVCSLRLLIIFSIYFRTSKFSSWGVMIFWKNPITLTFHVPCFCMLWFCTLLAGISLAFI